MQSVISGTQDIFVTKLDDAGSSAFPTLRPIQSNVGRGIDGFVAKLSANRASLVFSNLLGGSDTDLGGGIALGMAGDVHVAGSIFSSDFPTRSPLRPVISGSTDGFLATIADTVMTLFPIAADSYARGW